MGKEGLDRSQIIVNESTLPHEEIKEECEACNPPEKYKELTIKEYDHWKIGLHPSQVYLGRSVILLNRHLEDFFDTTKAEQDEFIMVAKDLRDALRTGFNADLLNYATLGNEMQHVHWHVIPRYNKPVVFEGITFEDSNWGKNYAPYDRGFLIPKEVQLEVRDVIKSNLE